MQSTRSVRGQGYVQRCPGVKFALQVRTRTVRGFVENRSNQTHGRYLRARTFSPIFPQNQRAHRRGETVQRIRNYNSSSLENDVSFFEG